MVPSDDLQQITGRGGVSHTGTLFASTAPGNSGSPGARGFLHGGAMRCTFALSFKVGEACLLHRV